jgi:hypothetical protein
VTYSNLFVAQVHSPDHPVWQWLDQRKGSVTGLNLELRIGMLEDEATDEDDDTEHAIQNAPEWMQPLQTLSRIPGVQLRVQWVRRIADVGHPAVAKWLKQHGQLISHLTLNISVEQGRLELREFSEAAASCRSIDLSIRHKTPIDLADLQPVVGSLQCLSCQSDNEDGDCILRGTSAFKSMSQLTCLTLACEDIQDWAVLAKLTSLQKLDLGVVASGDPSPLSALTGLSSLELWNYGLEPDEPVFIFRNLEPFSTLQQLEVLHLRDHAWAHISSLQGLAGLSNLKVLVFESNGMLRSLEGISPGVTCLHISSAYQALSLAGIEVCTSMEKLCLFGCGVSSLHPLRGLSSLKHLDVILCCQLTSLEGLSSSSLQSLRLHNCRSLIDLSGVVHLSALISLEVMTCGVTSLRPLSQLGEGLQKLEVSNCKGVQGKVLELPNVQPTADVRVACSNVEVVLAGRGGEEGCTAP